MIEKHIKTLASISNSRIDWTDAIIKAAAGKLSVVKKIPFGSTYKFSFNEKTKNFSYKVNGITYNVTYQFELFKYLVKIGYLNCL